MIFSAGSKTFLVGEYSVLFCGSAVVLSTEPFFTLQCDVGSTNLIGINELSPAGELYKKHQRLFENLSLTFTDPHNGSGGFGASSAQFALLYKLTLQLSNREFCIKDFLQEYRSFAPNNGVLPSGADCVCQFLNHNIYFDSANCTAEKF